MKFKRLINKSKETRRKYEYYLSLGYSVSTSCITRRPVSVSVPSESAL